MKSLILTAVLFLTILTPSFAIDEDKKLHAAVGALLGAGASTVAHLAGKEKPSTMFIKSLVIVTPIFVGKEVIDMSSSGFSGADLAYDYGAYVVAYWLFVPVNNLLFGESAYKKQFVTVENEMLTYVWRW